MVIRSSSSHPIQIHQQNGFVCVAFENKLKTSTKFIAVIDKLNTDSVDYNDFVIVFNRIAVIDHLLTRETSKLYR